MGHPASRLAKCEDYTSAGACLGKTVPSSSQGMRSMKSRKPVGAFMRMAMFMAAAATACSHTVKFRYPAVAGTDCRKCDKQDRRQPRWLLSATAPTITHLTTISVADLVLCRNKWVSWHR